LRFTPASVATVGVLLGVLFLVAMLNEFLTASVRPRWRWAEDPRRSHRPAGPRPAAGRAPRPGTGPKGEQDYNWAWLATASARRHVLIRRRLTNPADLAYFYCHVPSGRACSFTTLVRVAGRR